MPFPYLGETHELNETTRASADGSFASLPDGITHYELGSPYASLPDGENRPTEPVKANRPSVVLVHGFSVPYYIFDPTFSHLTRAGFRVLRYDLFGRGWSDRPQVKYNLDLFVRQLRDLLDALDMRAPVSLVGLSMGGAISAAFTVRHPERVACNIFIDPAGVRAVNLRGLRLLRLPLLGELALGFGGERMVKNAASAFFDPQTIQEFQARYRVQMRFAGFRRAILSSMRNGMLGDFSETYRQLGALGKPVRLFWGRQDTTVPFAHSADLLKLIPQATLHAFDQCGHIPHYERPAEFNPLLAEFLTH
ncbi:MAG: alpha/beta hydrolase [Chloroflexi bacterium]|nr:alpha/beta hydrolase [Chloroflexota bacterium]